MDSSNISAAAQDFICPLKFCQEPFVYLKPYISHLKTHMKYDFSIGCPFPNCTKSYSVVSSFSTHLSRNHCKNDTVLNHDMQSINVQQCSNVQPISDELIVPYTTQTATSNIRNNSNITSSLVANDTNANVISLVCLLQLKYFVPSSTIDVIISETADMLKRFSEHVHSKLKVILQKHSIHPNVVTDIMLKLSEDLSWPIKKSLDCLNTEYLRKTYIRDNFLFVSPISKVLPLFNDIGENVTYMYVPLL